ncbi:hypothetical protein Q9Q94_06930 [Uliginosibacterium sp. 31-16]|uniref:hypothetical protein n=1 Tax=Uliginosibacterium sp. 31-16 TaxID=3068315 RepID=UPI00273E843D|nr:hypothetical protein [Uliginosibacterium sp. 31-16]MDP5239256.1 hypothetical protein [Uliginosibacterium sp. 31-16]
MIRRSFLPSKARMFLSRFFRCLSLCCLGGMAMHAGANGGVWDTPHRAAGNLLQPSARLALLREELDISLRADSHAVSVRYVTRDRGARAGQKTYLYFPVVCHALSAQDEKPADCVRNFRIEINGQAATSQLVSPRELAGNAALRAQARRLNARVRQGEDVEQESPDENVFFRAEIPATLAVETLTLHYEADYRQQSAGTSKSPGDHHGPARMVYDFSPAAAWAAPDMRDLVIRVDASGLQGPLQFDARRWPFAFTGERAQLTLQKPDLARLPVLVLRTDNAGYRNYTSFMDTLQRGQSRYQVLLWAGQPAAAGQNIAALTDRNPETFWCWRGPSVQLLARLQREVITPDTQIPKLFNQGRLAGIGLLNGAVVDQAHFTQYGLARKIHLRSREAGAEAAGQDAQPENRSVLPPDNLSVLPLQAMRSPRDRFRTHALLEIWPANIPGLDEALESAQAARKYRSGIAFDEVLIEIQGVHARKGSDENCISEIYPVYLF